MNDIPVDGPVIPLNTDEVKKVEFSPETSRALIPNTTRFPSSQPVPPFLPFPTFFLSLLACAVFSQPVR
ncbi:hypothetical protein MJN47_31840, partial [Salmonella enterica subsp. enterica serovar Lubbock]|nr:hypothetical protein [Salmonella enterica subsp. enterica serovar Lubbock]